MEFVYWAIFIGWTFYAWIKKIESKVTLFAALSLFVVGAVFTVLGLAVVAEPIMRLSLLGWLIGIFLAAVEYKKEK